MRACLIDVRTDAKSAFHWRDTIRVLLGVFSVPFLYSLWVWEIFEDLVDPLSVKGHVDEDARLVGSCAASSMDAHSHNDLDPTVLTDERAAVIPLQGNKCTFLHSSRREAASIHILSTGVNGSKTLQLGESTPAQLLARAHKLAN